MKITVKLLLETAEQEMATATYQILKDFEKQLQERLVKWKGVDVEGAWAIGIKDGRVFELEEILG